MDFETVRFYLGRILVMLLICGTATWLMSLVNNRLTYGVVQDIRRRAIRKLQVLPLSYLDSHSTGDLVSRMVADATLLSDGLLLGFTQLFSGVIAIVVTLGFMISKSVLITAVVLVLTPVSFFVAKFIASRSFQMFLKQSEARGQQTALIEEMIGNQKLVQAFGYEKKSSERFAQVNQKLREYSQRAVFYSLSLIHISTINGDSDFPPFVLSAELRKFIRNWKERLLILWAWRMPFFILPASMPTAVCSRCF